MSFLDEQVELFASFDTTPEMRREAIRTFLPELIEEGYSRRGAGRYFREHGLSHSDTFLRSAYDEIRFNRYMDRNILFQDKDSPISELHMHITNNNIRGRYLYVVDYGILDDENENIERREYGFSSDQMLSKNQIMSSVMDKMEHNASVPMEQIVGMRVSKVFVNPDL